MEVRLSYSKKKVDLLKNALINVQKRKKLFKKGLMKLVKRQNLSENEFNQIEKMQKFKNYEDMKKEDLIISILKLKENIVELFNDNNNPYNDIKRIINRLRDIIPKKDRKEIKDKFYKIEHQRNISEEEQEEND